MLCAFLICWAKNAFCATSKLKYYFFQMLGEKPELLKERNQEGFTPLHIACREDLPECVQAFLCAGQVFFYIPIFLRKLITFSRINQLEMLDNFTR